MASVTVRCPACRGLSRVEATALGLTVGCPRCGDPFVALEEAELVAPGARQLVVPPPRRAINPLPAYIDRPAAPHDQAAAEEQDHDPHRIPPGGLPVSVLIGLALLPFAIPILWLIAPAVVGHSPMLSPAAPVALAVAASILCLAVIYTVDWTPGTRVKGVLMIVALAYFAALNLYFLKKQMVNEVKKFFGAGKDWVEVEPLDRSYQVKTPVRSVGPDPQHQPLPRVQLTSYKATYRPPFLGDYHYVVGSSPKLVGDKAPAATGDWYKTAVAEIIAQSGGTPHREAEEVTQQEHFAGREFEIGFADGRVRVIRLFVIKERVYYLSVEGHGPLDDDLIQPFFDSFYVPEEVKG
jgi:hypothetical protein